MVIEYSEYYSQASRLFTEFGDTLCGVKFDEKEQAVEVFSLMSLSLCSSHSRAVSHLLKGEFAVEPIVVIRSFLEILFDFYWIFQSDNDKERAKRVFRLEAHPYHEMVKEIRLIQKEMNGTYPKWYELARGVLEDVGKGSPFLLESNVDPLVFKQAPDLASRMGLHNRLRYYHLYRFASLFTHPTPTIKEVFVKRVGGGKTRDDMIEEALQQFLAYGLLFLGLILGYAREIFAKCNPGERPRRDRCCESMFALVEKGNKGFFSIHEDACQGGQTA